MTPKTHQKLAGLLVPVFAIRTNDDLGIGDTRGLRQMIDWVHRHGLTILQVLPINETGRDHSPYDAISSLALDPLTLDVTPGGLPDLSARDFVRLAGPKVRARLGQGPVNYTKVAALKRSLLEAAFDRFMAREFTHSTPRARQFNAFRQREAEWLADYALFRVLMEENAHSPAWERWPQAQQTPDLARAWLLKLSRPKRAALDRLQLFFMFVQWQAFGQWKEVKRQADRKKVFLMGDIPFGVGRNSADVWANRRFFDLDWSGGAPPEKFFKVDRFTEKWGQNWGIATYRWDELRRQNFHWWRIRISNLRRAFHFCRFDHVLGFFRIYSFPWTPDRNAQFTPLSKARAAALAGGRRPRFQAFADDTRAHRAANQKQGEELLRVLSKAGQGMMIVAEDLGVVPAYVRPTLQKLGLPGFRIPIFCREKNRRFADPKKYPRLSIVQPATHDHAPLAAYWNDLWKKIDAGVDVRKNRVELRAIMEFAGLPGQTPPRQFAGPLLNGYLRAVLRSNSWLAVVMITDVLGETKRFNTPGSVGAANWSERLDYTVEELEKIPALAKQIGDFARMAHEAGRGRSA